MKKALLHFFKSNDRESIKLNFEENVVTSGNIARLLQNIKCNKKNFTKENISHRKKYNLNLNINNMIIISFEVVRRMISYADCIFFGKKVLF